MYRGTTPTIIFTLPMDAEKFDAMFITFAQKKTDYAEDSIVIFEKTMDDCVITGTEVSLTLSEKDTLKLSSHKDVEIQIRAASGKNKMASPIYTEPVDRILKEGSLE